MDCSCFEFPSVFCIRNKLLNSIQFNLPGIRTGQDYAVIPSLNLKTHQMFSIHFTPENFKIAPVTVHFGFDFKENSGRKIT